MVLNLFIPAGTLGKPAPSVTSTDVHLGEGQYKLIPKRPDPLGADATVQYSIIGSTALAATFTSFASGYAQRVHPLDPIPRTALFIRSSARLGVWAGAIGAAVNWYYYNAFVGVVMSGQNLPVKPWKLYERTPRFTVDDGCLAGAALGLAASIPTLLLRRPAIPWWTKCLGMTNIGACAGILGAHGYLQYNGERQRAYQRLEDRLRRRSLEFWGICGDRELMSHFNPLFQQYIQHNAVWYTSHLAYDAYELPTNNDKSATDATSTSTGATPAEAPQELQAYYIPAYDYTGYINEIDVAASRAEIEELEAEKQALLKEAEYVLVNNAQRKYRYCHSETMDDDERKRWLRELHLCEVVYNRLITATNALDIRLTKLRVTLQHKAIFADDLVADDTMETWIPRSTTIDHNIHDPKLSIQELEKFRAEIVADVKKLEGWVVLPGYSEQQRNRWKKDLEDADVFLKAVDHVVFEMEKAKKGLEGKAEVKASENSEKPRAEEKATAKATEGKLEADKP
jgi:hypothetical protein